MTMKIAIGDAIRKVETDRLASSQRSGDMYQAVVRNRLSDKKQ